MRSASTLRKSSHLVLTLGFSLTGAGTVLLGVLLPLFSQRWRLEDSGAGFLLFLQFLGSSLGALCTGANRVRALAAGYGILIISAGLVAFTVPPVSLAAFFFWGLGLGMAMTATSLYVSDRSGDRRAANLERLNFAWSAGAMTAPLLFVRVLQTRNPRPLCIAFQALSLLMLLWIAAREREEPWSGRDNARSNGAARSSVVSMAALVVLALCAVGVESALSGWLTTYSHRANPEDMTHGALATSLFWGGILLSRLLASTRLLTRFGRARVLSTALYGAAGAVVLLIAAHRGQAIDAAALLGGLSIGPVYPLLLSYLLERSPRGWIFAVAGLGSAIFPWLTGALSQHLGSLRLGLIAPCFAAAAAILLRWMFLREGTEIPVPELSGD